jgi:putative sterol carrier protein
MPDSTDEFLDMLSRRGHEPLLEKVDATVRFDVADGDRIEHWRVQIARGDIAVTADDRPADAVISGDRATFDAIASGRLSMLAALLRGAIGVDGDLELVVLSRRLIFPRTDSARRPGAAGEEQAS